MDSASLRFVPATCTLINSKQRIAQEALLLAMSHTEAITLVLQIVNYAVGEKGMEHKGEQR